MIGKHDFAPDYRVPPGEILREYLESFGMSDGALAANTGIPVEDVQAIIEGRAPITTEIAAKLETALGRPAHFWRNLEALSLEAQSRNSPRL